MSSFARELIRETNNSSSQGPSFVPRASANYRRREGLKSGGDTDLPTTVDSTQQYDSSPSTLVVEEVREETEDMVQSAQHNQPTTLEEEEQPFEPTETKSSRKRRRAARSEQQHSSSSQNDPESTPLKRLRKGSAKAKQTTELENGDNYEGDINQDGDNNDDDYTPKTRSSSSTTATATTRRRIDPSMKLTISDYLHDTKSGKPMRAARRKMRQQEKQQRKKKRERLRAKGIQVETSDEEDDYDPDINSSGNNNNIQYDMYGNIISGGDSISGEDYYGSEHIINDGQATYYDDSYNYGNDDDFGTNEQTFANTYDDFDAPPPPPEPSSANSGSDAVHGNQLTGIAAQYAAEDEKDMELTDMYLEEDDDEDGQLDNTIGSNEEGMDSVPQIQFDENGQVVLNQSSVTITRNRGEAVDYGQYERVTETYGSKHITQATYARRQQKTKKWTKEDTYQLFDAIQQFGTDFSMIVRLFPTRSRREVRNKFKKEERERNPRLLEALRNRKPIDIEMFKKLSAERDKIQGVVRRTRSAAVPGSEESSANPEAPSTNESNNNSDNNGTMNPDEESQWEGGALEDEAAAVDDNGEYESGMGQDGEASYYSYDPYYGGEEEEVYNEEYNEYGS